MRYIFSLLLAIGFLNSATIAQASGQGPAAIAQLQTQFDKQQEEIRQLRGQIEELTFQLKKLQQHGERAAVDASIAKPPIAPTKTPEDKQPVEKSSMLAGQPTNSSGSRVPNNTNSANDYNEARTLLEQRNFAEAEVALTQFIKKYPKDPMLVNAYYWLAETHYIRSDYAQAALKFGEAYQAYLDNKNSPYKEQALSKGPEIMFKLASSLYNINKVKDAKVTLEELQEEFPKLPGNIHQQVDILNKEIARKIHSAS
jgi:tol-pal system protein YbgF